MGVLLQADNKSFNAQAKEVGFEGFEKRLQVEFFPNPIDGANNNLRSLSQADLQQILVAAHCTIVSELSNSEVDSYILSESSLFVYPFKFIIKTCGTTKLLSAVPVLLNHATKLSLKVKNCIYTRGSFIFPQHQTYPHSSFSEEVQYLDSFFKDLGSESKAYVMGKPLMDQHWHVYSASSLEFEKSPGLDEPIYTLEMCMTGLDSRKASSFFTANCNTAAKMTQESGIGKLFSNSQVCDYAFEPCGYSMNSLEKGAFSTIHVTPEGGYSYASFEAMGYSPQNVMLQDLVDDVLSCFRPASVSIALHISHASAVNIKVNSWVAPLSIRGYSCDKTCAEKLPGGGMAVFYTFSEYQLCKEPLYSSILNRDLCKNPSGYGVAMNLKDVEELEHGVSSRALDELLAATNPTIIGSSTDEVDDIIRRQVVCTKTEDTFYVMDIGVLVRLWKNWNLLLPRVHPFYAVKCNSDRVLLAILVALVAGFDVASRVEVDMVRDLGVSGDRIIFANPCKLPSHIQHASKYDVHVTTFDSAAELYKLHKLNPKAEAVLRIRVCDSRARCPLGVKYGAEMGECENLLLVAKSLGLTVVGIAFHVGSGASDPSSFAQGITQARQLFDMAKELGINTFRLLDIGGGFVSDGGDGVSFSAAATSINDALERYFPPCMGTTVIAEPGRFFAEETFTLAAQIFGIRARLQDEQDVLEYWINDGIYGSMNCLLYDHATLNVRALPICSKDFVSGEEMPKTTIFGPTCDGLDTVMQNVRLPRMQCGDWLVFPRMGAYTKSAASCFNGFDVRGATTLCAFSTDIIG